MPIVKTVKKVPKFSTGFYVDWINEKFKTDYKAITELRDGYTYCQLLNNIFPKYMNISHLKKENGLKNWKKIERCLKRIGIVKTVRINELFSDNIAEHTLFAAWFKEFYENNESESEKVEYLLKWISHHSSTNVKTLEELSNGFSYGLLLWNKKRGCINVKKLIPPAACSNEECRRKNLTVLNRALKGFKITVPVDAMSKLDHQACLGFLQLFKNTCDLAKDLMKGKINDHRRFSILQHLFRRVLGVL